MDFPAWVLPWTFHDFKPGREKKEENKEKMLMVKSLYCLRGVFRRGTNNTHAESVNVTANFAIVPIQYKNPRAHGMI